jgi:hypothetical protein
MKSATLRHIVKAAAQTRYDSIDAAHVGALKKAHCPGTRVWLWQWPWKWLWKWLRKWLRLW